MLSAEIPNNVPSRLIVSDTCISENPDHIPLIPLHIIWPDQTDQLDTDISGDIGEFYVRMQSFLAKGLGLPKTAQPSPHEFVRFYTTLYERGAREIGSVHILKSKSGTYDSAVAGAREATESHPDMKIVPMDSGGLSLLELFQVKIAMAEQQKGTPLEEIKNILLRNAETQIFFHVALQTLDNAVAGGRVSIAKAVIANLLHMKPVVWLHHSDLEVKQTALGMKPAMQRIVDNLSDEIDQRKAVPSYVGTMYTRDLRTAELLLELLDKTLASTLKEKEGIVFMGPTEAGVLLGTHGGAGAGGLTAHWTV